MAVIDIAGEFAAYLRSEEASRVLHDIVRSAVREELRNLLQDELLDTRQAAELLNMSQAAVRKAVERGHLPHQKIGGRLRFRRSTLLQV